MISTQSAKAKPTKPAPETLPELPFTDAERRLSRLLDRAQVQLEAAATDPQVAASYRRLLDELEALIP